MILRLDHVFDVKCNRGLTTSMRKNMNTIEYHLHGCDKTYISLSSNGRCFLPGAVKHVEG